MFSIKRDSGPEILSEPTLKWIGSKDQMGQTWPIGSTKGSDASMKESLNARASALFILYRILLLRQLGFFFFFK